MPKSLFESSLQFTVDSALWSNGNTLVAGVSGGQDSCALLHILARMRNRFDLKLICAHYHHSLRPIEADEDAEFVRELADTLKIPFMMDQGDVRGAAKRTRKSIQEAARTMRHAFLRRVSAEAGASKIVLAHTYDDHVETVLMHIIRGTGIHGLRGLPAANGNIVRPLVFARRDETAQYCSDHGIGFRDDSSNGKLKYMRNRVRMELLPLLESYYNPEVRRSLARISNIAAVEDDCLDEITSVNLATNALELSEDRIALPIVNSEMLHPAIARRLVRAAIEGVRGDLHGVQFDVVDRVSQALLGDQSGAPYDVTLSPGLIHIQVTANEIVFAQKPQVSQRRYETIMVNPVGSTDLACWKASIDVRPSADRPIAFPDRNASHIWVDQDAVALPLAMRSRLPGDRIQPLGLEGSRKVQDILVDAKVPSAERNGVPIVTDASGILWVVGHALADRAKVTHNTKRLLNLEFIPRIEGA